MTMDLTLDPPRQAPPLDAVTNQGASYLVATGQVAARTLKKFIRSPALLIAGTAQGLLFLLIFRYVFGGAVGHTGGLSYVDFLVPGFVVTGVLFQGMSAASGVADDKEGGLFDRLRSLPIRLLSIVSGRVGADTALVAWGVVVMTVAGFAVGFRVDRHHGRRGGGLRPDHPLRLRLRLAVHRHGPRWPAARRRRRGSRSWSSRSASSRRPTCRCRPCRAGCRPSPTTSP